MGILLSGCVEGVPTTGQEVSSSHTLTVVGRARIQGEALTSAISHVVSADANFLS